MLLTKFLSFETLKLFNLTYVYFQRVFPVAPNSADMVHSDTKPLKNGA
jgi:hypothetical protein